MSATYNLATDVGKVRLNIGDRTVAPATAAHFTDEELTSFLTTHGSVKRASGFALLAWAAELATGDEMIDTGFWKGDRRDVVAKMKKIADAYLEDTGGTAGRRPYVKMMYPVGGNIDE